MGAATASPKHQVVGSQKVREQMRVIAYDNMIASISVRSIIEYFTEADNAKFFAPAIEDIKKFLTPMFCIYEAFKGVKCVKKKYSI
ncbi:MAG: hypothetical protein KJZ52_05800 [Anaerolineales bacterium]|nr:hypothetical protein [Anaerolineales bacterium]